MKRLIGTILIFVFVNIVIGIFKYEYLIRELQEITYCAADEVFSYRVFSYSSYIVNIAIVTGLIIIISSMSFFVLVLVAGDDFDFVYTSHSFLYATSWIFIVNLCFDVVKVVILLNCDLNFISLHQTNPLLYEYYYNNLMHKYLCCDLVGSFCMVVIYFVILTRMLKNLSMLRFLPSVVVWMLSLLFFFLWK